MDKERETGDGTLDRFTHYPYAPSIHTTTRNAILPPIYAGGGGGGGGGGNGAGAGNNDVVVGGGGRNGVNSGADSGLGLDGSRPISDSILKTRNQVNLSTAAYTFPPGFVDATHDDLNRVIRQTIMKTSENKDPVSATNTAVTTATATPAATAAAAAAAAASVTTVKDGSGGGSDTQSTK